MESLATLIPVIGIVTFISLTCFTVFHIVDCLERISRALERIADRDQT